MCWGIEYTYAYSRMPCSTHEREGGDDMLDDLNISSDHAATNNNEEGEEFAADSSKRRRRRQKC